MRNMILPLLALVLLAGCSATQGWFTKPTTQAVIDEGCKAAAADDTMHNVLLNQVLTPFPQFAVVQTGLNAAHLAIQAAYAKCMTEAAAMGAKP